MLADRIRFYPSCSAGVRRAFEEADLGDLSYGNVASFTTRDDFIDALQEEPDVCVCVGSADSVERALAFLEPVPGHVFTVVLETRYAHGLRLAQIFPTQIQNILKVDSEFTNNLKLSLGETVNNAIEHGNLDLSELKHDLDGAGSFDQGYFDVVEKRLKDPVYAEKLIVLRCWLENNTLHFRVHDEGKGFDIGKIDSQFSEEDNEQARGRGLGLIKTLTDKMVYTDGGRCVTFTLKAGDSLTREMYFLTTAQIRQESKVLVVDDQMLNRQLAIHFLHKAGFKNVLQASGGQQALDIARDEKLDLIMLDIVMPDMDGFEVCRRLKSSPQTSAVPVVFMSALSSIENRTQGYELGAVDYINKPIDYNEMMARADIHIRNGMLMRQLREYSARVRNDLEQAREFQIDLLPKTDELDDFSERYGVSIESEFSACEELAGDYWSAFALNDDRLGIVVADFSGHGVVSALNTVKLHASFLEFEHLMGDTEAAMRAINDRLHTFLKTGHFATCVYGIFDKAKKTFTYSGCGAPAIGVMRHGGEVDFAACDGVPLGLMASDLVNMTTETLQLNGGDTLLFYSDALTESVHENGLRWEDDGLLDVLKNCLESDRRVSRFQSIRDRFFRTVQQPLLDDLTLMTLTVRD